MNLNANSVRLGATALWVRLSLLMLTAEKLTAVELPSPDNHVEVFLMGNEQAIINRFAQERTDKPVSGRFSNSLDHAFALLTAKANPKPDVARLSRATITSLCEEFERLTGAKIGANQRDAWALAASGTQGFDSVLKNLAALDPKPADQQRVIEAGLNGMLRASGWDYACVLSQVQADEMKRMSKARETPAAERGVLGLKVDRWPVVEAIADAPAAEAGVRNGDVVVGVNGEDIARVKTVADALRILQGPPGEIVKLTVKREGKTLGFEVARASIATTEVGAREVEPGVLLIKISTFEGSGIAATVKRLIHTRATNQESVVILDLRDNAGGRPEEANGVADIFLDGKLLQVCEFRDGTRIAFKSNPGAVGARVILLTNNGTGSGAEMLAMALRDYSRAIIVGENTCGALFGKDIEELSGGQTIVFRMEPTVLSPAGHDYSLTGIPPDVKIPDSRSKEEDEILVRALALARGRQSE